MTTKLVVSAAASVLLTIIGGGAVAQAQPPKWYLSKSVLVTETTPVVLSGKLSFHYTAGKTKIVSKCTVAAEGTISNSGFEGGGLDEVTHGEAIGCVHSKNLCGEGPPQQVLLLRAFPWGSRLAAGPVVRDELAINEVAVYCGGGLIRSSGGLTSPLFKSSGVVFDKGHGFLPGNGGITVTGKWNMRTAGGAKIEAK